MTEQYQQYNINETPIQPETVVSSPTVTTAILAPGTTIVDTSSTDALVATLPLAASAPGSTIVLIASTGAAASVTPAPSGADTLEGTFTSPIVTNFGNITFVSDGVSAWVATSNNA